MEPKADRTKLSHMSYEAGDGNRGDSQTLVTFMVFDSFAESPIESGIIRGILMSKGIPFFFFERTKGNPASIRVPASRLDDAKRAVAEARRIGLEIEHQGLFKS
jgi:hypothetical protein